MLSRKRRARSWSFAKSLVNRKVLVDLAPVPAVVIVVALDAVVADADIGIVALLAAGDRGHEDIAGFLAPRGGVTLGAVQHAVVLVTEAGVPQPAVGDV